MLAKAPGQSGYHTIAVALRDRGGVDLTAGLIGPVPPVAWPEGCRCAPLTGLGVDSPFGQGGPALAVKVSNAPKAYPQTGLHMADLIYEEPALSLIHI